MIENKILPLLLLSILPYLSTAQRTAKAEVDTLVKAAIRLREGGHQDQAAERAEKALSTAKSLKYINGEVDALIEISIGLEDAVAAFDTVNRALNLAKNRYKRGEGNCYVELGHYYKNIENNYDSALVFYGKALKIRHELKDSAGIASVYNNLSSAYLELYRWDEAEECSKKAVAIYSTLSDQEKNLIKSYNSYANILEERDIDLAIQYNQKTLSIINRSKDKDTTTWIDALYGLGKRHLQKGQYEESKKYFQQYLHLVRDTTDTRDLGMAYEGLGAIEFSKGNLDEARDYFEHAKKLYSHTYDSSELVTVFLNLGDLFSAKEEFNTAQIAYDSALSFLGGKVLPGSTLGESIEKNSEINRQRHTKYFRKNLFIGFIIFAGFLFIFISYRWLKSRWENIALKEKVLVEKELAVFAQREANEINKELLDLREEAVKNKEEIQKLKDLHHRAIKGNLATILAYLKSGTVDLFGFTLLIEESINILKVPSNKPLAGIMLGTFTEQMRAKANFNAKMNVHFSQEIDDAYNYQLDGLVSQNLSTIIDLAFSNIRIHANCTVASLFFEVEGNALLLKIQDNGQGFDKTSIRKNARGVADIEGKAKIMKASCKIDTAPGEGTTITVVVPSPFIFPSR